jgi:hypothetical protein
VPLAVTKDHINAIMRVMSAGTTSYADGDLEWRQRKKRKQRVQRMLNPKSAKAVAADYLSSVFPPQRACCSSQLREAAAREQ